MKWPPSRPSSAKPSTASKTKRTRRLRGASGTLDGHRRTLREGARQMPNMKGERLGHLIRFYSIIEMLESNIGGAKKLTDCSGRMSWPKRGVYFFREPGENRTDTGE